MVKYICNLQPHILAQKNAEVCKVYDLFIKSFLYARLKNGTYYAVAMSVRPSVRLSVRPSVRVFRTFFQHAFRYHFETWYIHLVGGTTCRV